MKVSVCMATYNGEKYIKEQLDSILIQLDKNDEIIISDDSSNDKTIEIIESFNDNRIIILKNNKFKNPIFNLENALKEAKGDIILLADQDDIWENEKVERMKYHLNSSDLVVSDCYVIKENNKIINDSFFELRNSGPGFLKNLYANTFLGCCMGFNRIILRKAIPFPKSIPMHDIWLGLIAEIYSNTCFIEEKLIRYRRHGNNFSYGGEKSGFSFFYKLKYRMQLLVLLLIRIIMNFFK